MPAEESWVWRGGKKPMGLRGQRIRPDDKALGGGSQEPGRAACEMYGFVDEAQAGAKCPRCAELLRGMVGKDDICIDQFLQDSKYYLVRTASDLAVSKCFQNFQ